MVILQPQDLGDKLKFLCMCVCVCVCVCVFLNQVMTIYGYGPGAACLKPKLVLMYAVMEILM